MLSKSKSVLFLLSDVFVLLIVYFVTSLAMQFTGHEMVWSSLEKGLYIVFSSLLLLMFYIEGLYTLETFNPAVMPVSLIRASAISLTFSVAILTLLPTTYDIRNSMFLITNSLLLPYLTHEARAKILQFLSLDEYARGTVLIGSEETIRLTNTEVSNKPFLGFRIKQIFTPDQFRQNSLAGKFDLIAVERALIDHPLLQEKLRISGAEVIDIAYLAERVCGKVPLSSITEGWIREHNNKRNTKIYELLKGLLDRSVALLMILALVPLAMLLIPFLLVVHGRPVFFKQTRTGLNNRPFTLFKLRSMVNNAEKDGARWSCPGDGRITRTGKWLRKTRIDELPQLYNILKGEMSLVGPRPERPEIIEKELGPKIPFYNLRHLVKPGATGWAQVTFRYGFSTEDSKEKLQYDLFYIKNRDIWMDIVIIIKTIKTVLTGAGQ